jgi:hypothetical protein
VVANLEDIIKNEVRVTRLLNACDGRASPRKTLSRHTGISRCHDRRHSTHQNFPHQTFKGTQLAVKGQQGNLLPSFTYKHPHPVQRHPPGASSKHRNVGREGAAVSKPRLRAGKRNWPTVQGAPNSKFSLAMPPKAVF